MMPSYEKMTFKTTIYSASPETASEYLSSQTGLSKSKIKDAMKKGAVWFQQRKGKMRRLRRATALLRSGERIELYYDEKILSLKPPDGRCISDQVRYSVWYKPPGLMAQGTMFGDHCSLLRQVELYFRPQREVFPVHRLDREASGLMLLAHSKDSAAKLSALFRDGRVIKQYRAEVLGNPGEQARNIIELPLDGKTALTEFETESYDPEKNTATVSIYIKTGRLHQIRRHFDMIGHPVMGDPKYGNGNKNTEGMKLSAVSLRFTCPFNDHEMEFTEEQEFW